MVACQLGEILPTLHQTIIPGGGAIEAHATNRIRFRTIRSVGGVTLRLETGIATFNGIQDRSARDIVNVNGRVAVLFQPHAVRSHNRVSVRGAEPIGSGNEPHPIHTIGLSRLTRCGGVEAVNNVLPK